MVTIFNTQTGAILQTYSPPYLSGTKTKYDTDGAGKGIMYTPDGLHLLFSQDGYNSAYKSGTAYVTIANLDPSTGLITSTGGTNPYPTLVAVPIDINSQNYLTNVTCFPNSPGGTTGSINIPCGQTVSIVSDSTFTSYPMGLAISPDGSTAYAVLDNNDTLAKFSLTAPAPTEVIVGAVPNSVVISPDGKTAYVSNEAGPMASPNLFQEYSNGTPVVAAYPTGATLVGTVSVINLGTFTVTGTIFTGLHPTGMAFWGKYLLVANAYSDSISVIDTTINRVAWTINLGLPIGVPGQGSAYGAGPNSIAVDAANNIAYVALYNANAIAVVNPSEGAADPVIGMIPVAYAPSSVVLDAADNALLVANDKGIGTAGFGPVGPLGTNTAENSYAKYYGVSGFNSHQDLGTVSIVPIPNGTTLAAMTTQVYQNNHWDLAANIASAAGGSPFTKPVAIPAKIGDPSKIKHVFVIIRENRTYDQILGDVAGGNGDAGLAVFGDESTYAEYPVITPNAHALVERFPLLDNFYDPSRQSADGHNWIVQAMAPYSDDIQSPDWLRDYPSNGGDALAYQKKGNLYDLAARTGITMKNYGEYIEYNTFTVPGCTPTTMNGFVITDSCEPTWTQFYNDTLEYENGKEPQLQYYNTIGSVSPLPNVMKYTVQNYPQFDLNIPDQYRVDVWEQDFAKDVAAGKVPQLEFMWISSDHTGGPPNATAMQADNDLALGRFVDIISHSAIWSSSAIFVEEDDAQNGVDHVDGHRSPGYVISPYVNQVPPQADSGTVIEERTFYTQVNMTRTIEQILGLTPMNQNDLVASPMRTLFIDNPPRDNFNSWTHVANGVPLTYGVAGYVPPANLGLNPVSPRPPVKHLKDSPAAAALRAGWLQKKAEIFAGKYHTPDAEDPDTVSHYNWYEATGFVVPFPGEKTVRPASDFNRQATTQPDSDD
ncbi:MAG TPA: bifunctional YncE family protein/alkaline phosphatase family protein [Nitrospiria bacterium]|nr:bifunctional YncE family protein/alkaline phosphatase family protein [Nitrospiria bacterium]